MVDVSEEVYDTIVEPYKRNKKFSKLIETLLLGCMENDGVAEYVESKFSSYYKQANHAFNGAVGSMMTSLAMVGIMADTASEMMEDGKRAVKFEDDVKVIGSASGEKRVAPDENAELKREVEDLRRDNENIRRDNENTNKKLEEMSEILMKLLNGEFKGAEKEVAVSKEADTEVKKVVEFSKEELKKEETTKHEDLEAKVVTEKVEEKKPEVVKAKPMSDDDDLDEDDPLFAPVSFEDEDSNEEEIDLFEDDKKENEEDTYLDSLLNGQVYTV